MALGVVLFLAVSLLAGINRDYPNSQDEVVLFYFDPWTMCDLEPIPESGNCSRHDAPMDEMMLTEPEMVVTLGSYNAEAGRKVVVTQAEMRVMLGSLVAEAGRKVAVTVAEMQVMLGKLAAKVAVTDWHDVYSWVMNTLTGMAAAFKKMGPAERSFWTVCILIIAFVVFERASIISLFSHGQISEVVALRFSPHLSKDYVSVDDIIEAMAAKAMLTEAKDYTLASCLNSELTIVTS